MEYDILLTDEERKTRNKIAADTRAMIVRAMPVEDQDESSVMLVYEGFYLQISFSQVHPLLVIYLAKAFDPPVTIDRIQFVNALNLKSVLGGHALNEQIGCYSYRATHWLDSKLTEQRFFEILNRCLGDAKRGYQSILGAA